MSNKNVSEIDLILLGLIKKEPQSAYDLQKSIDYRNISKWVKISVPSIYKKVIQLEKKNYIYSETQKLGNMPDKTIYHITDKGNDYIDKLMLAISSQEVNMFLKLNTVILNLGLASDDNKKIYINNIKENILNLKEFINDKYNERQHIAKEGKYIFEQQIKLIKVLENWILEIEKEIEK